MIFNYVEFLISFQENLAQDWKGERSELAAGRRSRAGANDREGSPGKPVC